MNTNVRKLTVTALLLSACVVGAHIKILGSIAFDAVPAFIGAALLGPAIGAFLGFFGHMISALLAGFPQTAVIHLMIGCCMALCMLTYGVLKRRFKRASFAAVGVPTVIAYLINVPLTLLFLYPLLGPVIFPLFLPLTIASVFSLLFSEVVLATIPKQMKTKLLNLTK